MGYGREGLTEGWKDGWMDGWIDGKEERKRRKRGKEVKVNSEFHITDSLEVRGGLLSV